MSKQLLWPHNKEAEARAYAAWADAEWKSITGNPAATFSYVWEYVDEPGLSPSYPGGAWCTPFLGPDLIRNGVEVPEPEGGPAMRGDAEGPGVFPAPAEPE